MTLEFAIILGISVSALIAGAYIVTRSLTYRASSSDRSSRKGPQRARTASVGVIGLALAVVGIFITGSPLGAFIGLASAALALVSGRHQLRKDHTKTIECWPTVLEDIRIQVGTMGTPLPQAFFLATRRHRLIDDAVTEEAERVWLLGGSFDQALDVIGSQLSDDASQSALLSLTLCFRDGGNDIASRIEDLRAAREADRQLWREMNARLGSVRVARAFVLVVPLVMGLLGYLLGGSNLRDYQGIGAIGVGIATAVVMACWTWSSALMAPPMVRARHNRPSAGA
ncbi:MAG: hypothetical protein ACP5PJ_09970, partial [Acidimicrobiales bacterium]